MPRKHVSQTPDPNFTKALTKALKYGTAVTIAGIHLYPPRGASPYWRLHTSYMGEPKQKSGGASIETAYTAFCEIRAWLDARIAGATGAPEGGEVRLYEVLESYIASGGRNYMWKASTKRDRARDLQGLIAMAKSQGLTCAELSADHVRTFINGCAGTAGRGQFLINLIATFLDWGYKTGYFTHEQVLIPKRVQWVAPAGSAYAAQPTRRRQSQQIAETAEGAGGEVPTHEQVTQLAEACQLRYVHGEALIHVAANTGLRSGELLMLTASQQIADSMKGNLVDVANAVIRVKVQPNDDPTRPFKPTKNGKTRAVVLPPVERIATGFDVRAWLERRCQEALDEQARGVNPNALLFPNATGGVLEVNNVSNRIVGSAADSLGWRMPGYETAKGRARSHRRFTLHSMRDRFATTAVQEWGYSQVQLLDQGSWADMQTVQKFYLGTTDQTLQSVRDLHKSGR